MRLKLLGLAAIILSLLLAPHPGSANEAAPEQPSQAAEIGFSDGFEAATLGAAWSIGVSQRGVVELNTDYVRSGGRSVFLGQNASGDAVASLILSLDLSGQTDVYLDYWARAIGVGEYRRLYISDNGGASWSQIWNLDGLSRNYGHRVIDLSAAAAAAGRALNDQFQVRFTYSDLNGGPAGTGMVIDDLRISTSAEAVAAFPLAGQSFETDELPQGFYAYSSGNGQTSLSTDYPRSGSRSIYLGQNASGEAAASLVIAVDLSGQTDVYLDYWSRATGVGEYRRVYISDNSGASWSEIWILDGLSRNYGHRVIDLSSAAAAAGRALNDQFQVRFTYSDLNGGSAGNGMVIDDLRISTSAEAIVAFPLAGQSFETDELPQGFYAYSADNGQTSLSTDYPRSGGQSVYLGQNASGDAAASLVIAVDLSGRTSAYLDFWARATGSGEYRRVYISDNSGASWSEILNLDSLPQSYRYSVIDLAAVAQSRGRSLNDRFQIRFTYSDLNGASSGNGMAIDDLRIGANNPISRIYLPLLQR